MSENRKGSFTLPGESGYEKLTLELAEKWGADVIRDSDGTELSDEILDAGYGIYSTICMIREHNEWAKKNHDKLQQCFLMTSPAVAAEGKLTIELMKDFFEEQFSVNDSDRAFRYWQVYDRTTDTLLAADKWSYDKEKGCVTIEEPAAWHSYTVSFMAYRIWEEISMYNHTTNNWDKEHLMQIDPIYPQTQEFLLEWMKEWCETHPATTVVRFTSMFYNFVWIWGSDVRNRNLFTDWGSYDFTVSEKALDDFAAKYGYELTAEDFINQGKLHVTHMPGSRKKADWMEFINDFVISFGRKLIDMVHDYSLLRIQTNVLNEVILDAQLMTPPPTHNGKRLRIYYCSQVAVAPPTFVLFVNDPELLHFSYKRFLENKLREAFDFTGTTLRIIAREKTQ